MQQKDLLVFTKLSLSLGARVYSILTIKVKNISFEQQSITIINHKSNRIYNGYFSESLSQELKQWIIGLSPEYYAVGRKLIPLARSTIHRRLKVIFDNLFNENVTDRRERIVTHALKTYFWFSIGNSRHSSLYYNETVGPYFDWPVNGLCEISTKSR